MKSKMDVLFNLISSSKDEISEIAKEGDEFYFVFRGKFFSISKIKIPNGFKYRYAVFVYPRFSGDLRQLIEKNNDGVTYDDAAFVPVVSSDFISGVDDFYRWLEEKFMGLDVLFRDLGI